MKWGIKAQYNTPSIPKWLSYLLDFFVPKWLSSWSASLEIWGSKSNIFVPNFHHQEVFGHPNFERRFVGVVILFYFKSHIYKYLVNGQRALISPKLGTRTISLGRREWYKGKLACLTWIWCKVTRWLKKYQTSCLSISMLPHDMRLSLGKGTKLPSQKEAIVLGTCFLNVRRL